MPKTPSGGDLPGPQQRAVSPLTETGALAASSSARATKMVAPLDGRRTSMSSEEQKRMQSLVATADVNTEQLKVQRAENKRLRNQLGKLLKEEPPAVAANPTDQTLA